MNLGGFAGSLLYVNLGNGKVKVRKLSYEMAEKYIGGFGICVKLAYDHIKPKIDPLSPENPIIIGTGPLVGTNAPSTSRVYAFTKLPANGAVGWGGAGGVTFASNMKFAGFDCVVVEGRARKPVFIKIDDRDVEICDANHLWGKGVKDTCDALWKDLGEGGVMAVGQAGENLVRFSMAYIDRLSTLGRGGIGAVMGSKRLKAIFVRGTGEVEIVNRDRYNRLCKELLEKMRNYPHLKEWQELGLLKSLPAIPKDVYFRLRKRRIACVSCPIGDKDVIELDGERIYSTSVVNLIMPLMIGMKDYRDAMKCIATLDEYGIDMFEFFGILSFARELKEKGILELDGEIDLGSLDSMLSWARKIAFREGCGDLLADGFSKLAEKSGSLKMPSVVKGMRAYVTPKGPLIWNLFGTMELGQIIDPRGPHVATSGSPTYFAKRPPESFQKHLRRMGVPENKITDILDESIRIGKLLCYSHIWFTILASLGICARAQINRFYSADICAELYSVVTGIEVKKEDLMRKARDVWTLLKLTNIREGFTRDDDSPPDDWFDDGFKDYTTGRPLSKDDVEKMIDEYYEEMGWKDWDEMENLII